jgi:hypothetical protein
MTPNTATATWLSGAALWVGQGSISDSELVDDVRDMALRHWLVGAVTAGD